MTRAARARKQLGIPEPVLQFKICPEDRKPFFWTVKIFRTRGKMRRYLDFTRPDRNHATDYAFTDQTALELVFCLYTMTDACVSHECWHATAWWINRQFRCIADCLLWDNPKHERAAEACSSMVSQIWRRFTEGGFERDQCWGFENRRSK
jgi:hypothetical protein